MDGYSTIDRDRNKALVSEFWVEIQGGLPDTDSHLKTQEIVEAHPAEDKFPIDYDEYAYYLHHPGDTIKGYIQLALNVKFSHRVKVKIMGEYVILDKLKSNSSRKDMYAEGEEIMSIELDIGEILTDSPAPFHFELPHGIPGSMSYVSANKARRVLITYYAIGTLYDAHDSKLLTTDRSYFLVQRLVNRDAVEESDISTATVGKKDYSMKNSLSCALKTGRVATREEVSFSPEVANHSWYRLRSIQCTLFQMVTFKHKEKIKLVEKVEKATFKLRLNVPPDKFFNPAQPYWLKFHRGLEPSILKTDPASKWLEVAYILECRFVTAALQPSGPTLSIPVVIGPTVWKSQNSQATNNSILEASEPEPFNIASNSNGIVNAVKMLYQYLRFANYSSTKLFGTAEVKEFDTAQEGPKLNGHKTLPPLSPNREYLKDQEEEQRHS